MSYVAIRARALLLSAPLIVMVTIAPASCSECSKYATFMPLTGGPTAGNFAHPRPAEQRRRREPCRQSVDSDGKFYPNVMPRTRPSVTGDHDAYTRLHPVGSTGRTAGPFWARTSKKGANHEDQQVPALERRGPCRFGHLGGGPGPGA